jgi:biotin carboxylase
LSAIPALKCTAQVEHGITEMVNSNVDIVEAQLRLQLGDAIGYSMASSASAGGKDTQSLMAELRGLKRTGHAIEVCRRALLE